MQEYKVPEFTVMTLSSQTATLSQESDSKVPAGSIFTPGQNMP